MVEGPPNAADAIVGILSLEPWSYDDSVACLDEVVGDRVVIWIAQVRELAGADVEELGDLAVAGDNENRGLLAAADKGAVRGRVVHVTQAEDALFHRRSFPHLSPFTGLLRPARAVAVGEAGNHDALGDAQGVCLAPRGLGYRSRRLINDEVAENEQSVIPDELRSVGFVWVHRRLSVRVPQEPRLGSRHVVGHDRHAFAPRRRRPIREDKVESRPLSVDVRGEDRHLGVDGDRPCDRDPRRPLGRQGVSVECCSAVSGRADRLSRLLRGRAEKRRPNHDRDDADAGDQDEAQALFRGGNGFAGILVRLRRGFVGDRLMLARVYGQGRGRGLECEAVEGVAVLALDGDGRVGYGLGHRCLDARLHFFVFGVRAQAEDALVPGDADVAVLELDDDCGWGVVVGVFVNVRGCGGVLRVAGLWVVAGLRVVAQGEVVVMRCVFVDGCCVCCWDCDRGKYEGTCRYQRQCRDFSSGHLWLTWSTIGWMRGSRQCDSRMSIIGPMSLFDK